MKLLPCIAALLMAAPVASAATEAAEKLFEIPLWDGFSLPVTNSIVTAWIVAILLIVLIRLACGKPKLVPSKGQYALDTAIGMFKEILEPILGKKAFPAAFPLLICLFFFILAQNWAGLIPGVGTIGWHETVIAADGTETEHFVPLFRALGADMNGTLGLALVSFGAWAILIFKYAGPKAVFFDWFGNKADKRDVPAAVYYFLSIVFFAVGFIEIISIVFRPVSLSFRLFGNVFGGETLMHSTGYFTAFYFLEILVGVVQALVFTLLSAVYIGLITNHDDSHEEVKADN
ncbi:MAG: F0F1 ATP synthase subunit A [Opitutales bacterium]|nr:F0F1 ATP synthase subunit A [Opitutales bacterium]